MSRTIRPNNMPRVKRTRESTRGSRGCAKGHAESGARMALGAKKVADNSRATDAAKQNAAIEAATRIANAALAQRMDPAEVARLGRTT